MPRRAGWGRAGSGPRGGALGGGGGAASKDGAGEGGEGVTTGNGVGHEEELAAEMSCGKPECELGGMGKK